MASPHVAIIGATGLIGRAALSALEAKNHPSNAITLMASERSEGEELDYGEDTLPVERVSADTLRGIKAAVLAVPATEAPALAQQLLKSGVFVVDVSGAASPTAPRVAIGLNDADFAKAEAGRVVSVCHPVAQALATVAAAAGLERTAATAVVAASWSGQRALPAFEKQTADLLNGREPDEGGFFAHRLAFNVLPLDAAPVLRDLSAVAPTLGAALTVLQVPMFHGAVVSMATHPPKGAAELKAKLAAVKGLKVLDAPAERVYPMPMLAAADDAVHVGFFRDNQLLVALDPVAKAASAAVELALRAR